MVHTARIIIEVIAVLGVVSSVAYYVLCIASAIGFVRERKAGGGARPTGQTTQAGAAVSILKPLKGIDPQMYECLRSHCVQDYAQFEVVFGVSEADDPAVDLVNRLQAEFPQCIIHLQICPQNLGPNTKVSNLAQMLSRAQHEYLLVNDSDIRVERDYLQQVISALTDPKVGLVTCLYRGVPSPGVGSRLESLSISTDFCAGVLAARLVEGGIHFGLGSTLALRRRDLAAIGGFEALADYLADDYEIGSRIAALGLEVRLSSAVVETFLPVYTLRGFIDHQLRWARTIRDSRHWGYVGLMLTFGIPWALVVVLSAHGARWAWELLGLATCVRLAAALIVGSSVLEQRRTARFLWLVPVRDVIAVFVWLGGFAGHTIKWRGVKFQLKDGKLERI
jgi:ceramide glucosyltransferase